MAETQTLAPVVERTISAIFAEQSQIDGVVRRLIDRGIPKEDISVLGRNFQSETRITGFITKRDVILGGLRSGAIFGSLFGSFLSLLTGVGVLLIPFVGPVVAAGPIGAILLGAASGAIAGSAGAGLVSVLTAVGMPEEQAALYQTRLEAGEFMMMLEVPADRVGEY
ncbi:general stress protein, partial [Chamaesiphon sp. OTE_8_metabat_110]|uniref:general stress protein n=1 Tax=Chamaesiphon sp. OTE_8_metabat_110 TaxID=2964696 RepID=UPI00286AA06E